MKTDAKKIFEYFGSDCQQRKLVEEVFEFLKAWILYDAEIGSIEHVIEEYADVGLVLKGFKEANEIKDKEVLDWHVFKSQRTNERMGNGYYDKN